MIYKPLLFILIAQILALFPLMAWSQTNTVETLPVDATGLVEQDFVSYPASYFSRFQPVTALDMVKQVPGFRLNDNVNDLRGFGTVAGNVLIDDRRPSTKRDPLSAILTRIPAGSVERIELIRGQVRNIDMRGQSGVLNIILRAGIPAAVQWELSTRKSFGHTQFKPEVGVSLSDNWKGLDYNIGLDTRWSAVARSGFDELYDNLGILEEMRTDIRNRRNKVFKTNLNAAGWWGETFVSVNTVYNTTRQHTYTNSDRIREGSEIERNVFFDDIEKEPTVEAGLDLERELYTGLVGKLILLYVDGNRDIFYSQRDTTAAGNQTLYRLATGNLKMNEGIARGEFDWSGFANHLVQFNAERVANTLDSNLTQTDDRGAGPVFIDVPGANGRVREIRWDTLLKDTWTLRQLELDYGLGIEASTISQTGDAELERSFFFLKPQGVMTWSWVNQDQSRVRLAREIAQLNLDDFISGTEFLDDDIALGNPNIEPESTWKLELSHEKRFGTKGVVKLTAFHHWITDVVDLLPITSTFEAPGNIGDGRRWGLLWESSIPLDWIALKAAKLDVKARWQDSSVIDPVTGEDRVLSITAINGGPIVFNIENEYAFEIEYRQDFQAQQSAWGWKVMERAEQYQYKVNEFVVYDENTDIHVYIETSRWLGVKMVLTAENILNLHDNRQRTIFTGQRDVSPLDSTELRDRTRGFLLGFTMSGSF